MSFYKKRLLMAFLSSFFVLTLFSNTPLEAPKAATAPVIDGRLDEAAWSTALRFSEFKTFQPDFGKDPSQKTEAFMLYDAENLYFAFRCSDNDPGKIKGIVTKRDAMFEDDYVGVLVDTFNDMQDAYGFLVNPLGIQGDGIMGVDGNMQANFDTVWYSKGQMDGQGYTAEFRIPLKSIRFPNRETIIMGVIFFRQMVRHSETISVPALSPEKGGLLSQSQPISVAGLKYHRVVEILPAITHSDRFAAQEGQLRRDERRTDFSLTAKVGLTSDLTTDTTYNPDFSQVEADAGQVDFNIRYAIYYPEKRPFFLEGIDYFKFAGNTEDAPLLAVVYSRTIINPIAGFKLTGKFAGKNTIAAIYAKDDLPGDEIDSRPDFGILRFRHAFTVDSYIGGFYTSRFAGTGYNQVAGSDGRLRLSQTSFAEYHLFGSFTRNEGSPSTENGHALGLRYVYDTRRVSLDFGYQDISPDFRVDSGFVTRTGLRNLAAFSMYRFYPKSRFIQRIEPFYWSYHLYDTVFRMFETYNLFCLRFWLPRNTMFRIEGVLANEGFAGERFDRSGYGVRAETQLTKQLYLGSNFRRGGRIFYDPDAPFQGYGNSAGLDVEYQPHEKLDFLLSLTYTDFYRKSDKQKVYDYTIIHSRNTFQVNKYLFLRAIFEYNTFYDRLVIDTLVSFTYIPGTVIHVGYGSAYDKLRWDGSDYVESRRFFETQRGFFFKVSYLWRW